MEVAKALVSDMELRELVNRLFVTEVSGDPWCLYREEYSGAYDSVAAAVWMSRS